VKDDGLNPTASYKDRASAVGVAAALGRRPAASVLRFDRQRRVVVRGPRRLDGLETIIFVPRHAPAPKVTQLLVYGARFHVDGDYDAAYELSARAIAEYGLVRPQRRRQSVPRRRQETAAFEVAKISISSRRCRHRCGR
jgi:threonine synthase